MMTIFNGDATPLLVGAGVLLIVLVVLFQFVTRPPVRSGKSPEGDDAAAQHVTILSRTVLDERRSLVRIRNGHQDHLLLLGDDGDLLIDTTPTPLSERNRPARPIRGGIPLPFPPQPAAKLNQRAIAEYQTVSPIPVPDFLQTRASAPAYVQSPKAQATAATHSTYPVMPPAMPSPHAHDDVTRKLEEVLRQTQSVAPPAYPASQPVPPAPSIPQSPIAQTSMPQARVPQPETAYPTMPSAPQTNMTQNGQSEAFEDEIRKLLGRNPHQG